MVIDMAVQISVNLTLEDILVLSELLTLFTVLLNR